MLIAYLLTSRCLMMYQCLDIKILDVVVHYLNGENGEGHG